jgi:hypothetical protein
MGKNRCTKNGVRRNERRLESERWNLSRSVQPMDFAGLQVVDGWNDLHI